MDIIFYTLIITIVILLVIIWFSAVYNHFQTYIIRINEVDANIDNSLRKRYDLIMKSDEVINSILDTKEDNLPEIKALKEEKDISNFELDRRLIDILAKYYGIKEDNPELKKSDKFNKIDNDIRLSDAEIGAYRRYYNDCITKYNHLVKKFPSNIVSLKIGRASCRERV